MGLDALVYCNCIEEKRLRISPPLPRLLYIQRGGNPRVQTTDEAKRQLHGDWIAGAPCEHPGMVIANCTLGNVALIDFVREVISGTERIPGSQYPVMWSKVIYSGCHAGDWLDLAEVRRLKAEVARLHLIQVGETAQNRATKDPPYLEEMWLC